MYRRRVEMLEKIRAALEEAGARVLESDGVEPRKTFGPLPL
jgi:hypothetical protein